jgi:glycine hydroxymethyltransferase
MLPPPLPSLELWTKRRYKPFTDFLACIAGALDPVVLDAVTLELRRQAAGVNLMASESMPSLPVMVASAMPGYVQTVEGTVGHRHFPLTDGIDRTELATNTRAQSRFGLTHVNSQPHTCTQAVQAVCFSALKPGDTILALGFNSGGHLSHGVRASLAGRFYTVKPYGPKSFEDQTDIDDVEKAIKLENPGLIIAGGSARPEQIRYDEFFRLGRGYGVPVLADISHPAGFIAAGLHPPVHDADFCVTSLHKTMCGPRGGIAMCKEEYGERLDRAIFPGLQGAVLPHAIAAKAACLHEAGQPSFVTLQRSILRNARAMAGVFRDEGFSLCGGTTDTHLILLRKQKPADAGIDVQHLVETGILTNANSVQGDRAGMRSGIRLGTTWISQLGFNERQAAELARIVACVLKSNAAAPDMRRKLVDLVDEVISVPAMA